MKTEKQPHEILYSKPSEQVFVYDEDESTRDWYSEDDIFDAMLEYAAQFAPEWVSVEKHGLPESKFNCIFYSNDLRNPCDMVAGIYFPDKGFMSGGQKWVNVTHYMAMPSKPTTKNILT